MLYLFILLLSFLPTIDAIKELEFVAIGNGGDSDTWRQC